SLRRGRKSSPTAGRNPDGLCKRSAGALQGRAGQKPHAGRSGGGWADALARGRGLTQSRGPEAEKSQACGAHDHCSSQRASEKRSITQGCHRRLRGGLCKLTEPFKEAISLSKEDVIEVEGIVREAMPNTVFKVELLNKEGKPNG